MDKKKRDKAKNALSSTQEVLPPNYSFSLHIFST